MLTNHTRKPYSRLYNDYLLLDLFKLKKNLPENYINLIIRDFVILPVKIIMTVRIDL
ncbi:hypothetical protein GFO_1561 [Christiangramia forsetii KT0803]|uniref:Uncharacterized protein n=1 Tax=Christiangramia forsetii (strain DSM 17595 / CGMCC 1.15422 / KT0803) TaxID=411154 RepID=A0M1N9_CHRFK|nr:hypothetical protein GFO_1561 [Christiangramia forsetii KT0803]